MCKGERSRIRDPLLPKLKKEIKMKKKKQQFDLIVELFLVKVFSNVFIYARTSESLFTPLDNSLHMHTYFIYKVNSYKFLELHIIPNFYFHLCHWLHLT